MAGNRNVALITDHGALARHEERLRSRIKTGQIIDRVQKVALGKDEMSATEFQAAKLLINKTIRDLPPHQPSKQDGPKDVGGTTPHQLLNVIEGKAERTG